jgi:hypothetical protein
MMIRWKSTRFSSAQAAEAAAVAAFADDGRQAVLGEDFAVESDGIGWFWCPLGKDAVVAGRVSRAASAEAVALTGEIPLPPEIPVDGKAYTYAKAVERLYRAAGDGDREAIRRSRITGVSTYALLVQRYRIALLAALIVRERGMA